MGTVNTTDTLAAAQAQAVENGAVTDESLNAGALLPDEPVSTPDVLCNEVAGDADTIRESLAKLGDEVGSEVTTESIYTSLAYLRQDMVGQHGMSQRIATEALSLLPSFGAGRPVNFYSRHPSQTGYTVALEEIEENMVQDVVARIKNQAQCLEMVSAPPGGWSSGQSLETIDFKRRADQVAMLGNLLDEMISRAIANGFTWDDTCFQSCAVDPSQNTTVPLNLKLDQDKAYSFAKMDEYYMVHLQGPALVEFMTLYMGAWGNAFQSHLNQLKATPDAKATVTIPDAPQITFGSKMVSIENGVDIFRTAYEKCVPNGAVPKQSTLEWVTQIGNASEQAKVEDMVVRLKAYEAVEKDLYAVLTDLAMFLTNQDGAVETTGANELITKFTDVLNAMYQTKNELVKWCFNAALATSFAATLCAKVTEFAWRSINQCKETLQMGERDYEIMKVLVEQIQAPIALGAV